MFSFVLEIFFPHRCLLCDEFTPSSNLCEICFSLCHSNVENCLIDPQKNMDAFYFYEFCVKEVITGIKFNRAVKLFSIVTVLIENALQNENLKRRLRERNFDAVCYIPTRLTKKLVRGSDITAYFASMLAKELNLPLIKILKRRKGSATQSAIKNRDLRKAAVKGVYYVKKDDRSFNHILLLDDVMTTGSTFSEAKRALHSVSKNVTCVAIAKTP